MYGGKTAPLIGGHGEAVVQSVPLGGEASDKKDKGESCVDGFQELGPMDKCVLGIDVQGIDFKADVRLGSEVERLQSKSEK